MQRRIFTAIATALFLGVPGSIAFAESTVLSAPEVQRLLTGNTAEGQWDGNSYRSYFGPDGVTIYAPEKGDSVAGKWRVNPETGQYDSFWDTIGWTAYTVLRTDHGFAWQRDGKTYPFAVRDGRRLTK